MGEEFSENAGAEVTSGLSLKTIAQIKSYRLQIHQSLDVNSINVVESGFRNLTR